MSDGLTDHLVERTRRASPFVLKYLPYGKLSEVMPYLSRRAIENKSVLGNGEPLLRGNEPRLLSWLGCLGRTELTIVRLYQGL